MIKQAITFILLMSFTAHTFNKVLIVVDYYVNTSSLAIKCENKAKPLMKCNGKCQMMKELKKEAQKDQQYPDRRGENKSDVVLYCNTLFTTIEDRSLSDCQNNYHFANEEKVVKMQRKIFHLPNPSIA
ncbi:MAG: hypothetical protein ABI237_05315 [Ginsengibacter sp.]